MDVASLPIPEIHVDPPHPLKDWFDHFREERQRHRDGVDPDPGDRSRRAVFTMVHNESTMLPIWLAYYSRFFRPEDIYVLDHDSDDGSTVGQGFKCIPVSNPEFDNVWQTEVVQEQQETLLGQYDVVLFTDVDEIVIPHPDLGDLGTYMDTFNEDFVNCLGYEVIHLPDREPALQPDRRILGQRRYWFENSTYSKAALATEPSAWEPGFHRRTDGHFKPDPDLFMVHLHRVDYDLCLERHRKWSQRPWSRRRIENGWGSHNAITGEDEFREWYFACESYGDVTPKVQEIPAIWPEDTW